MSNKKKIIIVRALKGYPDSRVEKEAYSLAKQHEVTVLGWDRETNYSNYKESFVDVFGKKIRYVHIGIKAPIGLGFEKLFLPEAKYWVKEYRYLMKHEDEYDIIHACDFDTAFIASIVAKKKKKKFVYDIFDFYAESHQGPRKIMDLIRCLDIKTINRSDVTIICSEQRKKQIKEAKPSRLCVIHNAPMTISLNKKDEDIQNDSRMKLVYVGLLSDDRYLKEIAKIIIRRKDIVWHIGGWGILENYFTRLGEKYENIKFYGKMAYTDILELEAKCDLMTALYSPSLENHKYAAPNKFYEALMLGKPVVMIKGTGMDKYISENNLGYVIDLKITNFSQGFQNAIDNFNSEFYKSEEFSRKSKKIFYEQFSWELMEKRLWSIYEEL